MLKLPGICNLHPLRRGQPASVAVLLFALGACQEPDGAPSDVGTVVGDGAALGDPPAPADISEADLAEGTAAVSIAAQIQPAITGRLQTFVSTTVQPQAGLLNFFTVHPQGLTLLQNRNPQHLHIQPHAETIPLSAPNTWNFASVDSLIQPVLPLGDRSHQYHALAPAFMWTCDGTGSCTLPSANFAAYSSYLQNLVRYYNAGGFTIAGKHFQSPSPIHLPYFAIFDEPNINGFSGARYAQLYNLVVPALQAIDPTLQIVAMELDDFDGNDPAPFLRDFAHAVTTATAPVAVLGAHYYASCNQLDSDRDVFLETPKLVAHLQSYRTALAGTALASTPLWLTESNINADFARSDGTSNCNPKQRFVLDRRGSSAFFAAWRPYTFSQVVKAGANVTGFYQFQYAQDTQYGELSQDSGAPFLSYWVDYWLDHFFGYRIDTGRGANLLTVTNGNPDEVEILAVQRDEDRSYVIMVANHALLSVKDNNGPGAARTVVLDLTALPTFTSGTRLTLDKTTNLTTGPTPVAVRPAPHMNVTLNGYGVAFLSLH